MRAERVATGDTHVEVGWFTGVCERMEWSPVAEVRVRGICHKLDRRKRSLESEGSDMLAKVRNVGKGNLQDGRMNGVGAGWEILRTVKIGIPERELQGC